MVYVPIEWGNIGITDEDCYEIEGFTFKEYTKVRKYYDEANDRTYDDYRGAKFYYTRNSYNVAYMNKSKNPVKEAPYKYEADINDAAAFVPSRPYGVPENYTFEGWYKDPECTEKFDFTGKIMPAHNVTVYANWVAPICNVEFVAYGETLDTLKNVPYGMDITSQIPQVGLHEGDESYGWTYDEAGMQPFNEGTKITSSIILYAQIGNKNGYTVTYDANGGTGKAPADSYRYARNRLAMVLSSSGLTAPTGKNFKGWNAAADGSGTMYQPGESISVSDNITLYAQWERTYRPNPPTSVIDIPDDDALGLNMDDHFAYIIGYPDGTVQPNGQITRAEATTIFFRLLTEESRSANLTKTNGYTDVASDAWYNTAVSTMTKAGIVDGYPDGTFRPDAPITRAEMAKIISLFAKLDKSESRFSDIAGHWAEAYIRLAAGNGWIAGQNKLYNIAEKKSYTVDSTVNGSARQGILSADAKYTATLYGDEENLYVKLVEVETNQPTVFLLPGDFRNEFLDFHLLDMRDGKLLLQCMLYNMDKSGDFTAYYTVDLSWGLK